MKRIIFVLLMLVSFAHAQTPPANYTFINHRYQWLGGAFKALNVPAGTTPALQVGQWPMAGALYVDTTGSKGLYVYYDGTWNAVGGLANNIYTASGILQGNRTLTGNNGLRSLTFDSLAAFKVNHYDEGGGLYTLDMNVDQVNGMKFTLINSDDGHERGFRTSNSAGGQSEIFSYNNAVQVLDDSVIILQPNTSATLLGGSRIIAQTPGGGLYTIPGDAVSGKPPGNGVRLSNDTLKIGGSLTDTTTYTILDVHANTSQFQTGNYTIQDVTSNQPQSDTTNFPFPGAWNYWRQRGGNELKRYERHFYEDRGDTAQQQYNSIVITKNVMQLDPASHRYRTLDGWKFFTPQDAGFSAGNVLYSYDSINMRTSPFGSNGNAFYGTFGFGRDSAFTVNLLSHPTAPVPKTVYAALNSFNDFVPITKKRVIKGGEGVANYTAWWKSAQGETYTPGTNAGSYVSRVTDYFSVGAMYLTPAVGLSTKALVLAESKVDTAVGFYSKPKWLSLNEVVNGYGFVQAGQQDINSFNGLTRMGYGDTWGNKTDIDAFINRKLDVGGSVKIRDTLTIGADPDAVFQMRVAGKVAFGVKSTTLAKAYISYYDTIAATTPTTINRVLHVDRDITLAAATSMGTSSGLSPFLLQGFYRPDAVSTFSNNYQGTVFAWANSFGFRDKGAIATQAITVGADYNGSAAGIMSKFATEGSGVKNITGFISNIKPVLELTPTGTIDSYSDFTAGAWSGSIPGTLTNRYGLYIGNIKQTGVTNGYAIYSLSATDTTYLAGLVRTPGINTSDSTNAKPLGIKANGEVVRLPSWPGAGGAGGSVTLSAIGSTPNANGATLTGSALNLEPANGSFGGVVSTTTQTFAGAKTFTGTTTTFSPGTTTGSGTTAGLYFNPAFLTAGNGFDATTATATTGKLMNLTMTGTAGDNGRTVLNIASSGANAASTKTITGAKIAVTNTGTGAVNVGLQVDASGGSTSGNFALIAPTGVVGIGTSTPTAFVSSAGDAKLIVEGIIAATNGGTLKWWINPSSDATLNLRNASSVLSTFLTTNGTSYFNGGSLVVGATTAISKLDAVGSFGANITTVTGNTTLDATHYTVLVDATSGNVTITLPAVAGVTRRIYNIKKIDASVNTVTIDGNASETIDGATTKVLAVQYAGSQIQANGTAWYIID